MMFWGYFNMSVEKILAGPTNGVVERRLNTQHAYSIEVRRAVQVET